MSLRSVIALAVVVAGPALTGETARQEHAQPVRERALARPPASPRPGVARGERVTVEVTSGSARLTFESTAESAGHMGDFVLVRNPANGRLFQAKVFSDGKVLIQK